jgi:hypothetical protein
VSALTAFYVKGPGDSDAQEGVTIAFAGDKNARRQVHQAISRVSQSLETKTLTPGQGYSRTGQKRKQPSAPSKEEAGDGSDSNWIGVFWKHKTLQKGRKRSHTGAGKKIPPIFVHFVMEKTGVEQTEAFQRLLRVSRLQNQHITHSDISFCGTKDKLAVTLQQCCVRCPIGTPSMVKDREDGAGAPLAIRNLCQAQTNSQLANAGVRVGNIRLGNAPLWLGGSAGNKFTIMIRGVRWVGTKDGSCHNKTDPLDILGKSFAVLREIGFVNYFGTQVSPHPLPFLPPSKHMCTPIYCRPYDILSLTLVNS